MNAHLSTAARRAAAVVAFCASVAACSDTDTDTDTDTDAAPAGFVTVEGAGFEISAPDGYERSVREGSNGEPVLVLEMDSGQADAPFRVSVVRDVNPDADAEEQSEALRAIQSVGAPEGAVTREEVPAPDGEAAYLITWTQGLSAEGAPVETTFQQLMYQVSEDLILNVVASAPSELFADSEVGEIRESFVPTG